MITHRRFGDQFIIVVVNTFDRRESELNTDRFNARRAQRRLLIGLKIFFSFYFVQCLC